MNVFSRTRQDPKNLLAEVKVAAPTLLKMEGGQFELLATLNKSSSGTTMLARHQNQQKLYAIKVLKKDFTSVTSKQLADNLPSERHPCVLNLEGMFESPTCIHLVMDFAAGGDLLWHLQQGEFGYSRARLYAAEICLAIQFFHQNQVVHRDLTLENIMLDANGHIKVSGYELCKGNMRHNSTTSTFCGHTAFLAPEVLLDKGYGFAVDWWSFGIMIYQMLLCKEPFSEASEDEIYDAILEKEPIYPTDIPPESVSIMQHLLSKEPSNRLGSSARDALDIMETAFFKDINFDDVYHRKVPVLFKPELNSETDLRNFGTEFTNVGVIVKPCNDW